MSKALTLTLAAAVLAASLSGAGAQTSRTGTRDLDVSTASLPTTAPQAFVVKRCQGVACLQGIPSVGVGF